MTKYQCKCSDLGYQCSYVLEEGRAEDILPMFKIHLRYAHNVWDFTDAMAEKVKNAIKEIS